MTQAELLALLGPLPDNDINLPELAKQMRSGRGVIPFVGAGLSVPYRFPEWGAFIRDMAKRAHVADQVEAHLKALEYEEAAELLQKRMHSRFQDLLEHYFGDQVLDGAVFRGAVALVPHVTTGPVITTNFDRLLERVFQDAGCPFAVCVWHDKVDALIDAVAHNGRTLLKLHGDWQFPNERVLTLTEYRKHYGMSKAKINFRLAIPHTLQLLVTQPMLFLGCSLKQDRTARIITQVAERVDAVRHFAIVEYPGDQASYDQRIDELERMHVRPVWYPQKEHDKIEPILAYLAEQLPQALRITKKKAPEPAKPDTLPRPASTFIGRDREKADLRAKIVKYSLVTVAGAPGAGKTRLTIEVARSLADEFAATWFVPLSQLPDAGALPQRIAHVLRLKGQPGKDLLDVVSETLKPGRQLLILDNCETVLDECAAILKKLQAECPALHVVLTSRIDLGAAMELGAEHVYRVPPLELPDPDRLPDLKALAEIDSVELLLDRVQARSDTFRLTEENARKIAQLCRGLDGIPLALELVAAQMDMSTVDSVLAQWDERLDFAGDIGLDHQAATLRKTIELSYDLLGREPNGDKVRILYRRLSVFHRGWTIAAAKIVCAQPGQTEAEIRDLLRPLRRASLIEAEELAGEMRYRYLDPIREFAWGELGREGEEEEFTARHARWATAFAERWQPELLTNQQAIALVKLIAEADNLRGAILWSERQQNAEMALRVTSALWRLMEIKGFYREGCARLHMALNLPGTENYPVLRSKALSGLSILAYRQGDLDTSEQCSNESLALERKYGSDEGIANALNDLGNVAQMRGEYEKALGFYKESLGIERTRKNDRGIAVALYNSGRQAMALGKLEEAQTNLTASLGMLDKAGNRREAAFALNALGQLAFLSGEDEAALGRVERSLAIRREFGDQRGVAEGMRTQASVLTRRREFADAADLLAKSGDIVISIGDERGLAETLEHLAALTSAQNLHANTVVLYAAAEELRNKMRLPLPPVERPARQARIDSARDAMGAQAFADNWERGRWMPPKEAFSLGANRKTQVVQGNP